MKRVTINGNEVTIISEIHDILSEALSFPEWYGRNLDALHDCLTDISEDTEIYISAYSRLEGSMGRTAKTLRRVIAEASEENPHIKLTIAD